jgi:hypothetical protein
MGKRKQTHHRKNTTTTTTAAAAAGAGASITSKRQRLKWSSSHKKRHKQRHQKFWIQDCPDLIDPDAALFQPTSEPDRGSSVPPLSTTRQHLLVYITAAYLQDDHPKMSAGLGTHLTMPTTSATAAATPTTLTSRDDSKSFPTTRADGKDDNDHTYQRATAVVVSSDLHSTTTTT